MIITSTRRVDDYEQGAGIRYEIRDTELVWEETKYGRATPTRWPVVATGKVYEPGCVVWQRTVYFARTEQGPHAGPAGGRAFVAAAREQERIARARWWLAPAA